MWLAAVCLLFVSSIQGQQASPPALVTAVETYAHQHGDRQVPSFRHAIKDLNSDGQPDAIVLLTDAGWCGSGGCTMLVFRGTRQGFVLISSSTITSPPVRVLPETSRGWKTLIVYAKGVGDVLMPFNGARYPSNPSMRAGATSAQMKAAEVLLR